MKYQKSMLKIYELLLLNSKPIIINDIIQRAGVGRTTGFKAINWLNKNGFIEIKEVGKQKEIMLRRDRYTLQLKNFIDSLKFKELDNELKYTINLFVENIKNKEIKSILLFGSTLSNKNPKDIDLLIIYDKLNREDILKIRDKTELTTNFIINLHFEDKPAIERLLNSICVFGFDNYIEFIIQRNKIIEQFLESVNWFVSAYNNVKDKDLFKNCIDNVVVNLGFAYSLINEIELKRKEEAKSLIFNKYRKLNKLEAFDNYNKLELIKGVIVDIGKEAFK